MHRFLSVHCLDWTKIGENNSYLREYYRLEAETLPLYRGLLGALWKNMKYTPKKFLPVNMAFFVEIQATAVPFLEKNGTKLYHKKTIRCIKEKHELHTKKTTTQHEILY